MSFYAEVEHTARKEHICNQCGQKINKGEKYLKICFKEGNEFFEIKHHLFCDELVNAYCKNSETDDYKEYRVDDWIRETVCEECQYFKRCARNIYHCPKVHKHLISERIE